MVAEVRPSVQVADTEPSFVTTRSGGGAITAKSKQAGCRGPPGGAGSIIRAQFCCVAPWGPESAALGGMLITKVIAWLAPAPSVRAVLMQLISTPIWEHAQPAEAVASV